MVMIELTGQRFKDATLERRSVLTALPIAAVPENHGIKTGVLV